MIYNPLEGLMGMLTGAKIPDDIELFLADEKNYVYIRNGKLNGESSKYGLMTEIKQERGSILDAMAKFEFVISEMIRIKISGFKPTDVAKAVNRRLSFGQRVDILLNLKILDKSIADKLFTIFHVRNSLAHGFFASNTMWDNKPIFENSNFENFKGSLQNTWNELINKYTQMITGPELDSLKKQVKGLK